MVDRLDSLRHDTVISGNNEDSDICNVRTSCSHGCESFMARSIKECYLLALILYLISTDMLCDTACLSVSNVSVSYSVEDRCLTMVNVTHNDNDRASFLQALLWIFVSFDKSFFYCNVYFLFNLCAKLFCNKCGGIKVNDLIDRSHYAKTHELFDDLGSCYFKSACKL